MWYKRLLLLLCLGILISHSGYCAVSDTVELPKWSLKGGIAPEYSYVATFTKDQDRGPQVIKYWHDYYAPKIGYLLYGTASCRISKHFFAEAGLQFSDRGYRQPKRSTCINGGPGCDGSSLVWVGRLRGATEAKVNFHYRYLSLPVYFGYYYPFKRFGISAAVGVSYDRQMEAYQWVSEWNDKGAKLVSYDNLDYGWNYNKNQYNFLSRIGAIIPIQERWDIESSVMFRYASSFTKPDKTPVRFHFYGISLGAGLIYKLQKP